METKNINDLWVDKYAPKVLDDYIINSDLRAYFKGMVSSNNLQNMTFLGTQGMGKTTLAKILCNEFKAETLFIKCAIEGNLDTLRTKITDFCNAMSFEDKIKIVILDEVDSASGTGDNNFQKGLRNLIETSQEDTRFLLTANYNKIIPAVLSRCPLIPLQFDKKDLLIRLKHILDSENISYTKESLKNFIEDAFKFYPDVRRIINYLQFCSNTGTLIVKLTQLTVDGKFNTIKTLVDKTITETNLLQIRKFYISNKGEFSDYIDIGSKVYNYVVDNDLISAEGILKLTDYVYYLNTCVDKESVFFGMLVVINKYKNH